MDAPSRDAALRFDPTGDTFRLLDLYEQLWRCVADGAGTLRPRLVGVTLFGLTGRDQSPAPDLFGWSATATENPKRLRLSAAMDTLNQRYGSETVAIGTVPKGLSRYMGAKIAFNRVPDRGDFRG